MLQHSLEQLYIQHATAFDAEETERKRNKVKRNVIGNNVIQRQTLT
jgi:hypothetical protein